MQPSNRHLQRLIFHARYERNSSATCLPVWVVRIQQSTFPQKELRVRLSRINPKFLLFAVAFNINTMFQIAEIPFFCIDKPSFSSFTAVQDKKIHDFVYGIDIIVMNNDDAEITRLVGNNVAVSVARRYVLSSKVILYTRKREGYGKEILGQSIHYAPTLVEKKNLPFQTTSICLV